MKTIPNFAVIFLLIFLDQLLKFLCLQFHIPYTLNNGISFGLMNQFQFYYVFGITLILLIITVFNFKRLKYEHNPVSTSLVLVISGGLSNLVDRLLHQGVFDYIRIGILPVFNLADVYIVSGAMIIIYAYLRKK